MRIHLFDLSNVPAIFNCLKAGCDKRVKLIGDYCKVHEQSFYKAGRHFELVRDLKEILRGSGYSLSPHPKPEEVGVKGK